jgi:hypothetical protein
MILGAVIIKRYIVSTVAARPNERKLASAYVFFILLSFLNLFLE